MMVMNVQMIFAWKRRMNARWNVMQQAIWIRVARKMFVQVSKSVKTLDVRTWMETAMANRPALSVLFGSRIAMMIPWTIQQDVIRVHVEKWLVQDARGVFILVLSTFREMNLTPTVTVRTIALLPQHPLARQ